MHIHSSAGAVRAGRYDELSLTGQHEFSRGVRFASCHMSGSALMYGCTGTSLVCHGAHISCQGDMTLETLHGYGDLVITGSLHCGSIRFTGRISVDHELVCDDDLEHTGTLHGPVGISTNTMRIVGAIKAHDIRSTHLVVCRLGNAIYLHKLTPEYRCHSVIDTVVAHRVHLEDASCEHVHADHVTLDGCCVAHVSYAHSLILDRTSHVFHTTSVPALISALNPAHRSGSYRRRA